MVGRGVLSPLVFARLCTCRCVLSCAGSGFVLLLLFSSFVALLSFVLFGDVLCLCSSLYVVVAFFVLCFCSCVGLCLSVC